MAILVVYFGFGKNWEQNPLLISKTGVNMID